MNHVLQLVRDILENEKVSAEEQLQLNKICELEDAFVKGFSKEKWKEYFNLDIEKGQLTNLQIDQAIVITYEICKKIFQKDDMFVDDNGVWHVILVCCVQADIMLVIFNDGTNTAKYVLIKTNGGERVESKFTPCNRY